MQLLTANDSAKLFEYLNTLSAESRSRFGPHPFDESTIADICLNPQAGTKRYVAVSGDRIVAYMLLQPGLIEADRNRYGLRNIFFEENTKITFAPSVADDFQNSGIGTEMFTLLLNEIKNEGYKTIVLWGGVQATNFRAVHFYEKHGFRHMGSFWHDEKDNHDMILLL